MQVYKRQISQLLVMRNVEGSELQETEMILVLSINNIPLTLLTEAERP